MSALAVLLFYAGVLLFVCAGVVAALWCLVVAAINFMSRHEPSGES